MVAHSLWLSVADFASRAAPGAPAALAVAAGALVATIARRRRVAAHVDIQRAREVRILHSAVDHWLLAFGDDVERIADALACEGLSGRRPQDLAARIAADPMTELACATLASSRTRWLDAGARTDAASATRSIERITTWMQDLRGGAPIEPLSAARELHTALTDLRRVREALAKGAALN